MTRTISLIIGIAIAALVAVPTAFGERDLAGTQDPQLYAPDWFERAVLVAESKANVVSRPDRAARDARHEVTREATTPVSTHKDAHERVDLPTTPVSAPVASSGRDVEWSQIGIGFGIGIALAIVLGLSLRATRPRTLAH
jgi:hypothetical protein